MVSLVDCERVYANVRSDIKGLDLEHLSGMCSAPLHGAGPFVIQDARADPVMREHPLVAGASGLRMLAGVPLSTGDGPPFGSLFVADTAPRTLSAEQLESIARLARLASVEMELQLTSPQAQSRSSQIEEEAAAIESEERFRLLARAAADVSWDWNRARKTIWWSEGATTTFGYPVGSRMFNPRFWASRIHPADCTRVLAGLRGALSGSAERWTDEFRLHRADGSVALVEARAAILRTPSGQCRRLVGHLSDVTARRAGEEELRQSQRLESIGDLTAGIAHEFNDLLTVIPATRGSSPRKAFPTKTAARLPARSSARRKRVAGSSAACWRSRGVRLSEPR